MPALRMPTAGEALASAGVATVVALGTHAFAKQRRARELAMGLPPDQLTGGGGSGSGARAFAVTFAVVLLAILTFRRPASAAPLVRAATAGVLGGAGDALGEAAELESLMRFVDQRDPFF